MPGQPGDLAPSDFGGLAPGTPERWWSLGPSRSGSITGQVPSRVRSMAPAWDSRSARPTGCASRKLRGLDFWRFFGPHRADLAPGPRTLPGRARARVWSQGGSGQGRAAGQQRPAATRGWAEGKQGATFRSSHSPHASTERRVGVDSMPDLFPGVKHGSLDESLVLWFWSRAL